MAKYPSELLTLIAYLKKLPGVGSKTAERFAFQLLSWPQGHLDVFADVIASIKEKLPHCSECGCLMENGACCFCHNPTRDPSSLCIISSAKDMYALEETHSYKGLYHVIGGLLSPLDGRSPDHLRIDKLQQRIKALQVKEIIIALDSTLEGDTTALYLKEQLETLGLTLSRLAFGLPMGSSLDFVDGSTLGRALIGRQAF